MTASTLADRLAAARAVLADMDRDGSRSRHLVGRAIDAYRDGRLAACSDWLSSAAIVAEHSDHDSARIARVAAAIGMETLQADEPLHPVGLRYGWPVVWVDNDDGIVLDGIADPAAVAHVLAESHQIHEGRPEPLSTDALRIALARVGVRVVINGETCEEVTL